MIATEVLTRFLRFDKPTELIATALRTTALLVPFDIALAQKTAEIYVQERKRKPKFGVADAHVLAAARVNGARILTCDNDFAGIPEAMIIR
jgi:predicted nucleic acid-binding protein